MGLGRLLWLRWLMGSIAVVLLAGAITLVLRGADQALKASIDGLDVAAPALPAGEARLFSVKEGESAVEIAARLEEQGLIRSAALFRLLAAYYGVSSSLEAGEYELQRDMTTTQIINKLHRGLVKTEMVTIPEGWRLEQVAEVLEKRGLYNREEFREACKRASFGYPFLDERPADATLEGYLFPDTYFVSPKTDAESFVRRMLQTFDERFTVAMRQQAADRGMTIHQVITLASIVEREAALPEERPLIAGIFLNRLKAGMALDADPTVQYALASNAASQAAYGYWKELSQEDLSIDSPYNTYRYGGLPPGPICSPGLASIQAVLDPEASDYLYFVAREDGSHAFATTLEEHIQNVAKYRN